MQKKVDEVGGLRASEVETDIDHSTIGRICNGRDATLPDFLILLKWVGGEMPKW